MDAGRVPQATASSVATASRQFETLETLLDLVVADAPSLIHTGYNMSILRHLSPACCTGKPLPSASRPTGTASTCRDLVEQVCDCLEAQALLHH